MTTLFRFMAMAATFEIILFSGMITGEYLGAFSSSNEKLKHGFVLYSFVMTAIAVTITCIIFC